MLSCEATPGGGSAVFYERTAPLSEHFMLSAGLVVSVTFYQRLMQEMKRSCRRNQFQISGPTCVHNETPPHTFCSDVHSFLFSPQKEFAAPPLLFRKLSNPDLSPAAATAAKNKLHRQLSQDESRARRSSMAMTGNTCTLF